MYFVIACLTSITKFPRLIQTMFSFRILIISLTATFVISFSACEKPNSTERVIYGASVEELRISVEIPVDDNNGENLYDIDFFNSIVGASCASSGLKLVDSHLLFFSKDFINDTTTVRLKTTDTLFKVKFIKRKDSANHYLTYYRVGNDFFPKK